MDVQKSKWQVKIVGLYAFFLVKFSSSNATKKLFSNSIAGMLFQEPSPPKKKIKAQPKKTSKPGWS